MVPIPTVVIVTLVSISLGATLGCIIASLCAVSGQAESNINRAELIAALAGVIINARFGLTQYPEAPDSTHVVEVPLTAGECRAILRMVDR